MKNKLSIHRIFYLNIITIALITIFIFGIWQIINISRDFNTHKRELHQKYETEQKEIIRSEVQKMVFYITYLIHHYENRADHDIELAKQEILESLVDQRFGDDGYFFGSTFKGDPLFSNGKITAGNSSVWELTDPTGVKIIQEQIEKANKPDGGFVRYYWNKLGETQLSPKISYVVGIPEWQWVIGAGVYVDDIEELMAVKNKELQMNVKRGFLLLGIVMIIFTIIFYVVAKIISKRIKRNFDVFFNFFRNLEQSTARIDENKSDFPEFETLAHAVNLMMERRETSEKALQISEDELKHKNEDLAKEIDQRREIEKSLKERNEYIETLLENMPIGFALNTIDDGVTRFVNEKFSKIYGWPKDELAKVEDFFKNVFPDADYRKELSSQVYEDMASGKQERMRWVDMKITKKNGEKRYATAINIPLIEQNLMISTVQDTTDRKIAEDQLQEYQNKLELMIEERTKSLMEKSTSYEDSQLALSYLMEDVNEARIELEKANEEMADLNRELESFSYSISHDLRAPLRAIDGFSKILEEEYGTILDKEGEEYLKIIRDNTQMMGDLISDLLEFSRFSRKNLAKTSLDMNSLVLEERNKIKEEYPKLDIDFQISELLPIKGDRAMIKQVYTNLVSNAVKYSSTRKKSIIEIGCKQDEDQIVYYVKDNGVGFDMKYSHKLFGVFQRLHAVEEFEGTGVGLAIVQRIVIKHGGRVWAESELNKGSTFYFTLQ